MVLNQRVITPDERLIRGFFEKSLGYWRSERLYHRFNEDGSLKKISGTATGVTISQSDSGLFTIDWEGIKSSGSMSVIDIGDNYFTMSRGYKTDEPSDRKVIGMTESSISTVTAYVCDRGDEFFEQIAISECGGYRSRRIKSTKDGRVTLLGFFNETKYEKIIA